jgi:hypothetical protein
MMRAFTRFLRNFRKKEEGTASIEFLIAIPVLMTIFMASFESGYFMVRHIMLERSVDLTMRELRMGLLPTVSNAAGLRPIMCARAVVLKDCLTTLKVELQPVSTATWTLPATPTTCTDRSVAINTDPGFDKGGGGEPVLVRVCVRQQAFFPTTGIALALPKDPLGGYALLARSVFINEPS